MGGDGMKRPSVSIKFDKDAIVDFGLRHGEKFLVGIIGLIGLGMIWGGVNAVRTLPASQELQPQKVVDQAGRAETHIQTVKQPPADVLRKTSLGKTLEPWRAPEIPPTPEGPSLNSPLFAEKSKRTRPNVLTIEQLVAVAGVAVLPALPAGAADPAANPVDVEPADAPAGRRGGKRGARGRAADIPVPPPEFGVPPEMMPGGFNPENPLNPGRGRLVPYCLVMGLIPFAKQSADYQQRFESSTFRDPRRDLPLWSDFLVERTVVVPGGKETWERLDPKQLAKMIAKEWQGIQGEQLPLGFLLAAEQNPGVGTIGYSSPLPQLVGDAWGPESIHPWFLEQAKTLFEQQAEAARQQAEQNESAIGAPALVPGFQSPLGPEQSPPGVEPNVQMLDGAGRPMVDLEYRMFRFIDMSVEQGKSYRYRVRLSLWNPNYNLAAQYLSDPALAKDVKLPSPATEATAAVTVPDGVGFAVRPLRKAERKGFKPTFAEVLVLAEDPTTGMQSLRSLVTEPGGLVNIDKSLNRPGDARTRGADVITNAVVIDVRGRQEERSEARAAAKQSAIPEPLEVLIMRADGSFAVASTADSEDEVDRFIGTLPLGDGQKPAANPAEPTPEAPFPSPFPNR
jgi:hypothetical protein